MKKVRALVPCWFKKSRYFRNRRRAPIEVFVALSRFS
jgi:hypothetical protein